MENSATVDLTRLFTCARTRSHRNTDGQWFHPVLGEPVVCRRHAYSNDARGRRAMAQVTQVVIVAVSMVSNRMPPTFTLL